LKIVFSVQVTATCAVSLRRIGLVKDQDRNQFGTPEWAKSFLRRVQIVDRLEI